MKAVSVLEHFSDHGSIHQKMKKNTTSVRSYPNSAGDDRWIPRGVSFQRPRHRLIAVASLGRLSRNRSIPVWFTRYPRTALSDRWRSLGITSLMNIGGIRYVHIHSYIGHHDQACVLAWRNPYMGLARFELRTGVTINEETTPENNKQKKLYVFL
ncbi:hypothetical protein TNCV_1233511 [Trichonephila clavipes]|nr:hypothetical protein TNCV_1233511 [Trichonephila clavipes]